MRRRWKEEYLVILIPLLLISCIWKPGGNSGDDMSSKPIETVLKEYSDSLMALPGVVGTAQGLCAGDTPCIKIYVSELSVELKEKLPKKLEGYPVDVEVTGNLKSLPDN